MNFTIEPLTDLHKQLMLQHQVWQAACPVPLNQLRLVQVTHYDFAGHLKQGELIVHQRIAEQTQNIFTELLKQKFPINSVLPIENFAGDDLKSMQANNSSAFNFRVIAGQNILSMHAYGLAIDINPVQNPYLIFKGNKLAEILPNRGSKFIHRQNLLPGMVEPIVKIFIKYGFEWGGAWQEPIDYHHFQIPRQKLAEYLI